MNMTRSGNLSKELKIKIMPKRIKKLTQKQIEAMPEYAKKWIEIGLKTGETDWDTFDKYMPICYQKPI